MNILEASAAGNLNEFNKCIRRGESTRQRDATTKRTALQLAIINGHENIVDQLLTLNLQDRETYKLLMDNIDNSGKTAKQYAIEKKINNNPNFLQKLSNWKKQYFTPVFESNSLPGNNCDWRYLRTKMMPVDKQVLTDNLDNVSDRYPVCSETLHTVLEHRSRKDPNKLKWSMQVDEIHHKLQIDLKTFANNDGNVIVVDITFEFRAIGSDNYQQVTFPLKITGRDIFTMTDASNVVTRSTKGSTNTILKKLFEKGNTIAANQLHGKHGHDPSYDDPNPAYQQYRNHSEQALVAYLATPEAAKMLLYRLKLSLHAMNIHPGEIKIYSAILHIHSDKTTCGPCERVILGFQNDRTESIATRGRYVGFVEQLESAFLKDSNNQVYTFRIPTSTRAGKESGLRCYVTFSASSPDGTTHKNAYPTVQRPFNSPPSVINISTTQEANHVHTALYRKNHYCQGDYASNINGRTFFSSASAEHKATPTKEAKYSRLSGNETQDLGAAFSNMGLG